ncbi:hypothetical protein D3C71_1477890 [compost metagenome]
MRIEVDAGGGDYISVGRYLQPVDQERPISQQLKNAGTVLHQSCAVRQHVELRSPVIHRDTVVVLQPNELRARPVAHAHAVVLELRERVGLRPESRQEHGVLHVMEPSDRVGSDPAALDPAIDAALREQDVALAIWVDLVLDAVVTAREVDRYLDDRRHLELGSVDIHPRNARLYLSELCQRVEGQDVPGDRSTHALHDLAERIADQFRLLCAAF